MRPPQFGPVLGRDRRRDDECEPNQIMIWCLDEGFNRCGGKAPIVQSLRNRPSPPLLMALGALRISPSEILGAGGGRATSSTRDFVLSKHSVSRNGIVGEQVDGRGLER